MIGILPAFPCSRKTSLYCYPLSFFFLFFFGPALLLLEAPVEGLYIFSMVNHGATIETLPSHRRERKKKKKLRTFARSSASVRQRSPRARTSKIKTSQMITITAQSEYSPPSPNEFCMGTAASVNTKAENKRKKLFVAAAGEPMPGLASTRYASAPE